MTMIFSCSTTKPIYIVEDVSYLSLSYKEKQLYASALVKANYLNRSLAMTNGYTIIYITINNFDKLNQSNKE